MKVIGRGISLDELFDERCDSGMTEEEHERLKVNKFKVGETVNYLGVHGYPVDLVTIILFENRNGVYFYTVETSGQFTPPVVVEDVPESDLSAI